MPQSNTLVIIFCLLLLAGCVLRKNSTIIPVAQKSCDLLLLAYDNGDGRAFRSLLPALNSQNIRWHLIAFGPAADLFEAGDNITILNQQVTPEEASKWKENRRVQLPENITRELINTYKPRIMLTGMAHAAQAYLTAKWWNQGTWTIAFYDNYEALSGQHWVQPWLEASPPVEEIFVPSARLAASFPKDITRSKGVTAVAHPTLIEWSESFYRDDPELLKKSLELSNTPIILIAGGYGNDYEQSLNLIAEAAILRPDIQWLIAPHPRTNAEYEQLLLNGDTPPPFQLITSEPTVKLASIADLVITHRSTVGWLSSQLGIPTIFVRPKGEIEHLPKSRVRIVNTNSSLLNAIYRELDQPASRSVQPKIKELPVMSEIINKRLEPPSGKPPKIDYREDTAQ